jgi:glutaredoxin
VSKVISLTLYVKPGCHLCDEARVVIDSVIGEFRANHSGVAAAIQIQLNEENILEDANSFKLYAEEIPVLQINGATHAYWRIDPIRLIAALESIAAD